MYASPAKNYALKFFEPVLKPYMPEETAPAKPEEEQDSHSEEEDL